MCGKPHVDIFEPQVVADLQQDDPGDRVEFRCQLRLALQPNRLAYRQIYPKVYLAGLHRCDTRRGVLDDLHGDTPDRRLRPPIFVIALQHDASVDFPFHQPVGASADRLLREILRADLLDIVLRHQVAAEKCQPHRCGRCRRAEMHHRLGR